MTKKIIAQAYKAIEATNGRSRKEMMSRMTKAEKWFNKLSVGGQLEAIYDAWMLRIL